jgi:hypothetical protein
MGKSNQWVMGDSSRYGADIEDENGNIFAYIRRDMDDHRETPTDEQWQSMVVLIAAAPEMLAMLKDVRERCDNANVTMGLGTFEKFLCNTRDAIDSVLARAEPPRTVKRKVRVEVEVEVEVPSSADGNQAACVAVDQLRDGGGTVISHRIM